LTNREKVLNFGKFTETISPPAELIQDAAVFAQQGIV
jgi:hypothetical protein